MKTFREKMTCDWSDASTSEKTPRIVNKHQKPEETRKGSSVEPSGSEGMSMALQIP